MAVRSTARSPPWWRVSLAIFGALLQGLKGALEDLVSQPFFFLLGQLGGTKHVHDTAPLHDAVRADHFCDWHNRGHLHDGDTGPFEFGGDRSTAARAGPSGGGEDHGIHPVGFELLGNLAAQAAAVGERVSEA